MAQPVIGLTLDHEPQGGYSKFQAGSDVDLDMSQGERHAGGCDPLAATIPMPPRPLSRPDRRSDRHRRRLRRRPGAVWRGDAASESVTTKDRRTPSALAAAKGALSRQMPVLGICGGQQLLNVALGGTLIQRIPDEVPDCLAHRQPNPRNEPGHTVWVIAGTLLHRITRADSLDVNSAHHQAVGRRGRVWSSMPSPRMVSSRVSGPSPLLPRRPMASRVRDKRGGSRGSSSLCRSRRRVSDVDLDTARANARSASRNCWRVPACSRARRRRWIGEGRVCVDGHVLTRRR